MEDYAQELKLADTLRYHVRDTAAAKDLLYRRLRSVIFVLVLYSFSLHFSLILVPRALAVFEAANKDLDTARTR